MIRKALAIVLIIIIALSVATWFVHNQISDLQNQIGDLQVQNSELQDQISELQDQNSALQDQLEDLQNQKSDLQDRLREYSRAPSVKITAFSWIGGFNPVGGVTLAHPVKVTVQNNDVIPASGLTLTVKLLYIDTHTEVGQGYVKQIDMIQAGEILEFSGEIWATIGSFSTDSAVCAIKLTMGDIVLDERTYSLS